MKVSFPKRLRTALHAPLLAVAALVIFPVAETAAQSAEPTTKGAALQKFFPESSSLTDWIAGLKSQRRPQDPPPPQLPRRFRWAGRYVVPDLGITVPFVWFAQDGNTQMIAGGPNDPVYFTNFIYQGKLYTYTYKWPGLTPVPQVDCEPAGDMTMDDFNKFLAHSRYVGPEILQEKQLRFVHHFRTTIVSPQLPPGNLWRWAIASADFYVEQSDSTKFRKVLHFGYQNLYDPDLDEWIIIDKFERGGGEMIFPPPFVHP